MKNLINKYTLLLFSVALIISGCTEKRKLKRKIDGTYKIVKVEEVFTGINNCINDGTFVRYSVDNPGKLKFTGKKIVQGTAISASYITYI